jgi:methionyl-tRNA synthetase
MPDLRKILVTSALPYANGPIHLGHLVEYIQTDIWVRFQRMRGHQVVYVCADDTHGTAIMLSARAKGISEAQWIEQVSVQHQRDFADFEVCFDRYGSTHSDENRELCHKIWARAQTAGLISSREVQQLYDPQAQTFLADRFVKGTCPKCGAPDQAGDNCDKCGQTYSAIELVDPISTLSGATPEIRSAPHFFFELEKCRAVVESWIAQPGALQSETANYLKGHFLNESLRDWDLSRTAPYFGFEIPDQPGHYWYVWFDAPVGYIATTWQWCREHGLALDDWWRNPHCEIHHFIGKDIVYFHTLFWPAILHTAGFQLPTRVHVHGFLTVNGRKMSKRDGTFIRAGKYLEHLQPAYLRYYYATKLGDNQDDLDLNIAEFVEKVNTDLVNKVVNLVSRSAKFATTTGLAAAYPEDEGRFAFGAQQGEAIAAAYDAGELSKAMRLIMELADRANQFVEHAQPWKLAKQPDQQPRLQETVTIALNLFRQIAIYLAPVLPSLQRQTSQLLGEELNDWNQAQQPLVGQVIGTYEHFMQRLNLQDVERMIEETKQENAAAASPDNVTTPDGPTHAPPGDSGAALLAEPLAAECTIEDFAKVDLRVARIVAAEEVPEARKLLKLTVSLGGDQSRQVFAGIKAAYQPQDLVGRLVIIVANLKPRQMKFGLSEGMVCAAGGGGSEVFLLTPDSGAVPGQRVH